MPEPEPSPLDLGRAAASQIGSGDWELDADQPELLAEAVEAAPPEPATTASLPAPASVPAPPPAPVAAASSGSSPPSLEQIVEAMLFIGGQPLTSAVACSTVRGLTPEGFQATIDTLNRKYRAQHRPYAVQPRADGFVLAVLPAYRGLRERLFAGPREARLSQPALDVLSVVAYRQPVGKAEIDATRGTDSAAVLRQLVRLGLVAVQHRADATGREVRYGTTPRFLQVFGLVSLDELPRLGNTESARDGITGAE